jgi:hypothetical protein
MKNPARLLPSRAALLLSSIFSVVVLTGCATPCCVAPPAPLVATPTKLTATGYGNPGSYGQYSASQQKLMAIRAAQVDAYRSLAERVHGFRVTGNTSVSAFTTQSDTIKSYVDAFIRGARVVNTTTIGDGNVEVTVELDMTPQFLGCFTYANNCFAQPHYVNAYPTCATYGCVAPSANYYSY